MNQPYGLAFDSAGNLYVANNGNSTIQKFTPGGIGSLFANTGLNRPVGLAFDSAGNLYVSNSGDDTIEKFTPGGVGSVFANTGLNQPYGLAFDSAGNLYVANFGSSTIEKFTPGGVGSVFVFGNGLSRPVFIAFGPRLYTVTPSPGPNGSISPNTAQTVNGGGSVGFTATPDSGYMVDQWRVNNTLVQTGGNGYTFNNVAADSTVQVTFTLTPIGTWRQTYFGSPANSGQGADTADSDGDGFTNLFEYVAGLIPTSAASRFNMGVAPVPGQPGRKAITFDPIVAGRSYLVTSKASFTDPTWLPLTSFTTVDNGTQRTVTDLSATGGTKFYRVEITLP